MIDTAKGIEWIVHTLRKDQSSDGSWAYPFDTGISTDAYMIILLRTLEIDDEELIEGLCQSPDLFMDVDTAEDYTKLLELWKS
jgi:sporulenol synthase